MRPGADHFLAKVGWKVRRHLDPVVGEGADPRLNIARVERRNVCLPHPVNCLPVDIDVDALFLDHTHFLGGFFKHGWGG